jgi:CDP-L-myo-inositol myo-inositolphosphotransferase
VRGMKALIIAAGDGSRMGSYTKNVPKHMIRLLGIPILERVILSAREGGIDDFLIVTGYLGDKIRDYFGNGEQLGVRIEYIHNKDWQKPNGISVLKAKSKVNENFILLMGDHIFHPEKLINFMRFELRENECALCVDKGIENVFDINDATKVYFRDGDVIDIGKGLKKFNAVDTGMFMCSPYLFSVLEKNIREGKYSLTESIRTLAREGKMKAVVSNGGWVDIDTPEDLKLAEKRTLSSCGKLNDGPISKWVNRKISTRITKLLLNVNVSPNAVSFISFLISILSGLLFMVGVYLFVLLGGIVAQLSSIIDGCDGEIARIKYRRSQYGGWLDACLDRYADAFIIFGMAYGYWLLNFGGLVWIIAFAALIGTFMNSYTAVRYKSSFKKKTSSRLKIRIGRDVRLFIIMVGAILNQILPTLIFLALLTNTENIRRFIKMRG